jgi:hypothetical protein
VQITKGNVPLATVSNFKLPLHTLDAFFCLNSAPKSNLAATQGLTLLVITVRDCQIKSNWSRIICNYFKKLFVILLTEEIIA